MESLESWHGQTSSPVVRNHHSRDGRATGCGTGWATAAKRISDQSQSSLLEDVVQDYVADLSRRDCILTQQLRPIGHQEGLFLGIIDDSSM